MGATAESRDLGPQYVERKGLVEQHRAKLRAMCASRVVPSDTAVTSCPSLSSASTTIRRISKSSSATRTRSMATVPKHPACRGRLLLPIPGSRGPRRDSSPRRASSSV